MRVAHTIETSPAVTEPIHLFRITNSAGAFVELTNLGATWVSAVMPDTRGVFANVLVGHSNLSDYLTDTFYMGATVGRFANRIAGASFALDGMVYQLEANDGRNTNHGGYSGFHKKLWKWEELSDGVRFTLSSPDGEGGYPGNVDIRVEYRFSEANEVSIYHYGTTDQSTYLNLTNHAYFNLSGTVTKIDDHRLMIPAERILETTAAFIPTGAFIAVKDTPFDFTRFTRIGELLRLDNEQLRANRGYNHCYILKEHSSREMVTAASLVEPTSGRRLTVETDLPGILLYSSGYYEYPDTAVCFETQYFPDTPHHAHFPNCILHLGDLYEHKTVFRFSFE